MNDVFRSRTPWNWQPYLSEMCEEIGVNYDKFIEELANNKTDMEIADKLNTSTKAINYLRTHFENYGIGSVLGQD